MKFGKKARKGCAVLLAAIWLSWGASAAITGLERSQTEIQLDPGETMELTVRALPKGSALPQLVFTSSDEQVAAVLGVSRVQVARAYRVLRQQKAIATHRSGVTILDMEKLKEHCSASFLF